MSVSFENALDIEADQEVENICSEIRNVLRSKLKKRGLVVAISGGVDSGVSAALCVKALGKNKVFGFVAIDRKW